MGDGHQDLFGRASARPSVASPYAKLSGMLLDGEHPGSVIASDVLLVVALQGELSRLLAAVSLRDQLSSGPPPSDAGYSQVVEPSAPPESPPRP